MAWATPWLLACLALDATQQVMGKAWKGTPNVESLDLKALGVQGFIGGFTDGTFGYAVPYWFNEEYHGKVARFKLRNFRSVRFLDLALTHTGLKGFADGFTDGTFGYLVPYERDEGHHGMIARFNLRDFSSVQVLRLPGKDSDLRGFTGGFTDGKHGFVVPYINRVDYHGKVASFNLQTFGHVRVLDLTLTDPDLKGFWGGFTDGTFGYMVPYDNGDYFGKVARFSLRAFDSAQVLDLTLTDADLKGFGGSFTDGMFGYTVPYITDHGKVARFDLQTFSNVEVLDLAGIDVGLTGFWGAFQAGNFGYAVPCVGDEEVSGKLVRFNMKTFRGAQVLDLTLTDTRFQGFCGGFAAGDFGYVVGCYDNLAQVVRFNISLGPKETTTTPPEATTTPPERRLESEGLLSNWEKGVGEAPMFAADETDNSFRRNLRAESVLLLALLVAWDV